jgi:hypothetical protein
MTPLDINIFQTPGRELCPDCGEPGAPCHTCGGCGLLPFSPPPCPTVTHALTSCGAELERDGWMVNRTLAGEERLPHYRCGAGHRVALRFLPVEERSAA